MERAQAGDLRIEFDRSVACQNQEITGWVPGTLNQMLSYFDKNNLRVAKTHRFLRPDGALAASGMEDPKRVVKDGVMYIYDPALDPKEVSLEEE